MSKKDAAAVLNRLWTVYQVKSDNELSDALNRNRSTLGSWRARNSVPYEECVISAEEKGVSLDWLLVGEGPMYRSGRSSADGAGLPSNEQALLNLFRDLDAADQQAVHGFAAEKRRLRQLEKRVEELAQSLKA